MQRYDVVLEGQLGLRFGTLEWEETGSDVSGFLFLLDVKNPIRGTREGEKLTFTHQLRTAVSTLDCKMELEVRGEELSGVVISQGSCMQLSGKKAAEKEREKNEISKQN